MGIEKSTLVVGASTSPQRYSYLAIERLQKHDVAPIFAMGLKEADVLGVHVETKFPEFPVDTVTLYVGPKNQDAVRDYLHEYQPNRVIFNPGTENQNLMQSLLAKGVDAINACTLVMLASNQY